MQSKKFEQLVVPGGILNNVVILNATLKPVTDEQVFYDKFLCDKFYLLFCTCHNFDKFFYDKCPCSNASMLAFEQVHLS